MTVKYVVHSDGSKSRFNEEFIRRSILDSIPYWEDIKVDEETIEKIYNDILKRISNGKKEVSSELIKDTIELVLIDYGLYDVFKAYILHQQSIREERRLKSTLGVVDEIGLTYTAAKILAERYLRKDEKGNIIETVAGMFWRVANAVAMAEKEEERKKYARKFYNMMTALDVLPNSPTLFNAGINNNEGGLSACYTVPIYDDMEAIFDAVKEIALISKGGGGVGVNLSYLRPEGDIVKSTMGTASGPLSFARVIDTTIEVVKQAGKRRGAMMGIMNVRHPDILKFITAKTKEGVLRNFNISVMVDDDFMNKVLNDDTYQLINPRNGEVVREENARKVFELITSQAWLNGEPGMLFYDNINRNNPTPEIGPIEAVNPCGEIPLYYSEACNLASVNVGNFVKNGKVDWKRLSRTIKLAIRFLDDVITVNNYPLEVIDKTVKRFRKVGLGIMGFADMLIKLGIRYNSEEAIEFAEKFAKRFHELSVKASMELAEERGSFPEWERSIYKDKHPMRNATVNTVAPTGTLSMIANCSSAIEPLFSIAYIKKVLDGTNFLVLNKNFERVARMSGFYSEELINKILENGSIQNIGEIPENIRRVFVTTFDIEPEWHIRMQAAFQKYVDNSIAKTINMPNSATIEDVFNAYIMAWKLGCKGITIYRDGSRKEQVLNTKKTLGVTEICPTCGTELVNESGCWTCKNCGYSKCSVS